MMRTRLLMSLSAAAMAIVGLIASFLPEEILSNSAAPEDARRVLLLQATGALYLGFAMLNWMARGNTIGGIYSRPIALGNFLHFAVGGIALSKAVLRGPHDPVLIGAAALYVAFSVWFGFVLVTHPASDAR